MWANTLRSYIQHQSQWMIKANRDERGFFQKEEQESFLRKKEVYKERKANIVNNQTNGSIISSNDIDGKQHVHYMVHFSFLIKQGFDFYVEEMMQERQALFQDGKMLNDEAVYKEGSSTDAPKIDREIEPENKMVENYRRMEAVRYAERWWNSLNPAFKSFNDNCTNFVSQCLHSGGIPMTKHAARSKGWWMRNNNWSYSWTVAHAFRWYLSGAKSGLRAQEVASAHLLIPGDIICYDFDGDNHWNHSTIVVAKDSAGEPLVNAHTTNSRMRYWGYEDSTAYTKKIQYKFFHIL